MQDGESWPCPFSLSCFHLDQVQIASSTVTQIRPWLLIRFESAIHHFCCNIFGCSSRAWGYGLEYSVILELCIIFPPSDPSPRLGSEIHSGNIPEVLKAVWQIVKEKNTYLWVRSLPRAAAECVFRVLHGRENVPSCLVGKFGVSLEYAEYKESISALQYIWGS